MLESFVGMVEKLEQQGDHRWLLLDLPEGYSPLTRSLLSACDRTLVVVHPDGNSHIRLHQQALPAKGDILINDLRVAASYRKIYTSCGWRASAVFCRSRSIVMRRWRSVWRRSSRSGNIVLIRWPPKRS